MAKNPETSFMLKNKMRVVGLENGCSMCGSPVHPATGHVDATHKFCGPCLRSLVQGFMECAHPNRTCSGVPFYKHAKSPPM